MAGYKLELNSQWTEQSITLTEKKKRMEYFATDPRSWLFPCVCILCICRNDDCVEGGENILLDLYPIVQELRKTYPHHFDTLTRVPVRFQKIAYDEGSVTRWHKFCTRLML